ncbi:hypothetical protein QJQ45_028802 [Haematococcus lacustris]|nr:hypothetical protein QJQ45_028802 [Haematococcus lacustris]
MIYDVTSNLFRSFLAVGGHSTGGPPNSNGGTYYCATAGCCCCCCWASGGKSRNRLYPRPGYSLPLAGRASWSGHQHSSSGCHLLFPMRCMFNAALQSLSSHLHGCGAALALAALPWALPVPLVGSAASGSALVRLLRLAGGEVLGPGPEAAGCVAAWLLHGALWGLAEGHCRAPHQAPHRLITLLPPGWAQHAVFHLTCWGLPACTPASPGASASSNSRLSEQGVTFVDRTCTRCTEGLVDDAMHFISALPRDASGSSRSCHISSLSAPPRDPCLSRTIENLHDFILSPCSPLFVHLAVKCVAQIPEPRDGEGGQAS